MSLPLFILIFSNFRNFFFFPSILKNVQFEINNNLYKTHTYFFFALFFFFRLIKENTKLKQYNSLIQNIIKTIRKTINNYNLWTDSIFYLFLFIVQKLLSENFFIQRFISLIVRTITEFYNTKISFAIKHISIISQIL